MRDDASVSSSDPASGQVITLLQVIAGLLVVIAIVLLVILARGPEDQERSVAPLPIVAALTARN